MFGPVALATQSIILVSSSTTFQAPYALGLAAAVRVGNLLGESKGKRAAVAAHAAFLIAFLIGAGWRCGAHFPIRSWLTLAYSTMFLVFRDHWGKLFNDDPGTVSFLFSHFRDAECGSEVISLVSSILPLVALNQLMDGLSAVASGILRAQGRQGVGALINLV
jgi:MATE family multidrug resistance protein